LTEREIDVIRAFERYHVEFKENEQKEKMIKIYIKDIDILDIGSLNPQRKEEIAEEIRNIEDKFMDLLV